MGKFVLNDGSALDFPPSLHVVFDFRAAVTDGTVREILCAPDCDLSFLYVEMAKLRIVPGEGSAPLLNKG